MPNHFEVQRGKLDTIVMLKSFNISHFYQPNYSNAVSGVSQEEINTALQVSRSQNIDFIPSFTVGQ